MQKKKKKKGRKELKCNPETATYQSKVVNKKIKCTE